MSAREKGSSGLEKIKNKIEEKRQKWASQEPDFDRGLSTGYTLLNLALTGRPTVGLLPGFYYRFIGQSRSGKTWLLLTAMAEATIYPAYDEYDLIYDGSEHGALMDIRKYFGSKLFERIRQPNASGPSKTIEEFYYNVDDAFRRKKPFFYVLDSMDGLTSLSEEKHFAKSKTAYLKGTKAPGSYGDGKAKKNSAGLRVVVPQLWEAKSILAIVSQSRDNIDMMSMQRETCSGGRSLTFYSTTQVWASIAGFISKEVHDKKLKIGQICRWRVDKTRLTGRDRTVDMPLYNGTGIDEIGGMIDWLVEWQHWKKERGQITAPEFAEIITPGETEPLKGTREEVVQFIESDQTGDRERLLKLVVAQAWGEIEAACMIERKKRYE